MTHFAEIVAKTIVVKDSGVFRISEGGGSGETPRWWGAGEGSVPPPQKKNDFYVPKMIILGAF